MPFSRPTLTNIIARIESDMSSRLLSGMPVLRRSFLGVLARVFAGISHMFYGALEWITTQILPTTQEDSYLEEYADVWGITRIAAVYATGNVVFTGTNGSTIPLGTQVQRADGVIYATTAVGTISGGTATVAVIAAEAGASGNCATGTAVATISSVPGINQAATVSGAITIGADQESIENLRVRVLQRIQTPPQGGAEADYVAWAMAADARVYKVFVFPSYAGPGTVGLTFITNVVADHHIPDGTLVTIVKDYVNARKPVTAATFFAGSDLIFAPAALPVPMTIAIKPNTTDVKAAVEAEITDLILRDAEPGGELLLSRIDEAISRAAGEEDHSLTVPAADVSIGATQFPVLGTITWSTLP
jgi:uncharacterized phage protein gp47/JayE